MIKTKIELPSEYQAVKYIRSTGTQYINTGIKPNDNTKVHIKFSNDFTGSWYIFGSRTSAGAITFGQSGSQTGATIFPRVNGEGDTVNTAGTNWARTYTETWYDVVLETHGSTYDYHIKDLTNNRDYSVHNVPFNSLAGSTINIYLCALNTSYKQSGNTKVEIFEIWQDGEKVVDYIPCYRKSDEEVSMYDLITKTFKSATGTFLKGENTIILRDIGFIKTKHNGSMVNIDKILTKQNSQLVTIFEQGFTQETQGQVPLTLNNSIGKPLKQYQVYGNSVQNGTPTPAVPVEIQSVGDRTINIFDTNDWYTKAKALDNKNVNKVIVDNISSIFYKPTGATASGFHYMENEFKTNTQYTIRFRAKYIAGTGYSTGFVFYYTDGSNSGIPVNREGWQDYSLTSNAGKTISYIRTSYNYAQGCYFDENSIQIAEGNTLKDYEPYGYKIPITAHGTNLWDINGWYRASGNNFDLVNNTLVNKSALTFDDGRFLIQNFEGSTQVGGSYFNDWGNGRYGVTLNNINTQTNNFSFMYYKSGIGSAVCKFDTMALNGKTITISFKATGSFLTAGGMVISELMCVEGTYTSDTMPSYQPRFSIEKNIYLNEPLRKISNYSDYIDFKNQKIVRNVGIKILDGTNLSIVSTGYQYGVAITHGNIGALAYADGGTYEAFKCTQLNVAGGSDAVNTLTITSSTYGVRFNFNSTIVTGDGSQKVNEIKSYLAQQYANGTPLAIHYVLATPTQETITLPSISTTTGTNILDVDTLIEPSNTKVIYKRS